MYHLFRHYHNAYISQLECKLIDTPYNLCMPRTVQYKGSGLILGLLPANERRRYKVMTSLIGWAQT